MDALAHNQRLDLLSQLNYQQQVNQMSYHHYVQKMQAFGLNKVQDHELQVLSAFQWQRQQQEALQAYQRMGDLEKMTMTREMQNLITQAQGKGKFSQEQQAHFQKMQAEKRIQEERRKKKEEEEQRRQEEEKRRHERQEEEKRR